MAEVNINYDRINDFASVTIRLASPEDIRSWSFGEVKKPETINYRTYRPEKDGLFCERIFGPEKDWECACGKYKGIKHKGIVCDKCGVMITHSRVRRKRMGHINLAAPVAHIWFFKSTPSRIGNLLNMKVSDLERVVYFQDYVVIADGGLDELKPKQKDREYKLLTEEEYRQTRVKHGSKFDAGMGAEAIRKLLKKLDLNELSVKLRKDLTTTKSRQRLKDIIKRLKVVELLRDSGNANNAGGPGNRPEWMILEVIPVIPPDLRPLVLLDSGNFATSDLNDLYRRLINRNNRLKKLLDLNAPEVIIRNEKRMLQQSVDALFDNGRCRRPVLGSSNRPLKSLTDMIKGKQGRFRENLLGKRVDYSARSVIVVGPELKLHQCGLPKAIALELFQPFIIRRLRELGLADTIKSAKKMLERRDEEVYDILEEVIKDHPVLLNRAPTLHRMGIQAFEPVLIEGNALKIHPLVCTGFNADFDGDQMAVHLPLSYEAQIEASTLMLATNNVFSPANGNPIISPSQDIVLGIFYLSADRGPQKGEGKYFSSLGELFLAFAERKISTHAKVRVKFEPGRRIRLDRTGRELVINEQGNIPTADPNNKKGDPLVTTAGRALLNDVLPKQMAYYNYEVDKKGIQGIISDCHQILGRRITILLLDDLKEIGFKWATRAGLSFSKDDMRLPGKKNEIISAAEVEATKVRNQYSKGVITDGERYNKIVDLWTAARERTGIVLMDELRNDVKNGQPYLNPIYCMAHSGARGSLDQIRQLSGMRGLMAKPNGKIIETPIKGNFREGLKVLEYFSSTHGARKGLADTALKTADAGYMTRKLADVAQNVVVTEPDCGALNGVTKGVVYRGEKVAVTLAQAIRGRTSLRTIVDPISDDVIVKESEMITESIAKKIESLNYEKILVRSPLTCEARLGICAKCYGMDLSRGILVEMGLAVGMIGAQSIGEPGTQLTMRTFHIGGTASRTVEESDCKAKRAGHIKFDNVRVVKNSEGKSVVLNRNGQFVLFDVKNREVERYDIPAGAEILVADGSEVLPKLILARWDPHHVPVLADKDGRVMYEDLEEGKTIRIEKDAKSGHKRRQVVEHKGDLHPAIVLQDDKGQSIALYPIPERAYVEVDSGEWIVAGTVLAKSPRQLGGTQDITGGLPRVAELFEARKPKNPAIVSEIDGIVELGGKSRGKRTIVVKPEDSDEKKEHLIPVGRHLRVHRGDRVRAGDTLTEGPFVPQDILRIQGEERIQNYLLDEIQNVYRLQGVTIDDKHIEVIVAQMMRKVQVEEPGDSALLPGAVIDKFRFRDEQDRLRKDKKKPPRARPLLLGISKAALSSESFISAASFQETTKVLTEAAIAGRVDQLVGLKENVVLGHVVPAGTGFRTHYRTTVKKNVDLETLASKYRPFSPTPDMGSMSGGLMSPGSDFGPLTGGPAMPMPA
ncbi:MAG: DNA-directed RNA polymerase subunit beta' [Planctomycetes bacterium]|nr:DNA-directed RNA polymerase subunit beta' [Planctomycetota bacterium]